MDLGMNIAFDRPWFLLLFLLLPVLLWFSFNSLAGLGKWRRLLAMFLRAAVFSLLVLALAQAQWQESTDRLTVIYLLDQSDSIPSEHREQMLDFVHRAVKEHRREEDRAGVIIFGGDAKIEAAPYDGDLPLIDRLEAGYDLRTGATSLEAALKLAKASFPEDAARRVVIVSDGNENLGDSVSLAQSMANDGVGIDVVPIELITQSEVSVDKVVLPANIRKGQEFEIRVVLTNDTVPGEDNPTGEVTGELTVKQRDAEGDVGQISSIVTLQPGKNVRGFTYKIEDSAVFTFDATFVPEVREQDTIIQNNTASAFTYVQGKGKVLLIEDGNNPGEFMQLTSTLKANSIEVDVMRSTNLFTSMAQLLQYDCVILANTPRATGETIEDNESFSDTQIRMLVRNCEEMGAGLIMLGGDRAFGAGGWTGTELEKAMPVDFQIKNDKIDAVGALVLIMHASEMADGNFWQAQIAAEAIKMLGPMDYCGVAEWGGIGSSRWLWKLPNGVDRVFGKRRTMLGMVNRMTPGDMPDFASTMRLGLSGLTRVNADGSGPGNASVKHMIIISDGDPTPPPPGLLQRYVDNNIKISTVACGAHMNQNNPLINIANVTGGSYYPVTDPRALPRIYQREARRVSKPVIKEVPEGMGVIPTSEAGGHEIAQGLDLSQMPPFTGYVMTTLKENPLVSQLAISSQDPDHPQNATLIATWRYGAGRATVFTSDAGRKWTAGWVESPAYEQLFVQMIRHSMRPITQSANFTVASNVRDNVAEVVVTALDDDGNFLNNLDFAGRGINPELDGFELEFEQTSPGRYVSRTPVDGSGNYLFSLTPGDGYKRLTTGVNVPYSSEYSARTTNVRLLDLLTQFEPRGGEAGMVIEGQMTDAGMSQLLEANPFRPTLSHAISFQYVWPLLLVICGAVFFADVFVRRVAVDFSFVGKGLAAIQSKLRGDEGEDRAESLARLQSRKAEVERQIESRRARTKFEPDPVDDESERRSGQQRLDDIIGSEIDQTPKRAQKIERDRLDIEEDNSYTSRLLDAKRKAQKKQDRGDVENE
ncbi:MAG: VWA domain-containing protein [Planctomycetota bacterium]